MEETRSETEQERTCELKIMKFLGYRITKHPSVSAMMWDCEKDTPLRDILQGRLTISPLKFNTDWSWLMAVIQYTVKQPVFGVGYMGQSIDELQKATVTANISVAHRIVLEIIEKFNKIGDLGDDFLSKKKPRKKNGEGDIVKMS